MSIKVTFSHRIEYLFTRIAAFTVQILPLHCALAYGAVLGWTAWVLGIRRREARINIGIAFPELGGDQVDRIGLASYMNSGRFMVEFIRQGRMGKAYFDRYITVEKTEALHKLLDNQGGVMSLSGHFGNWEYFGATHHMLGKETAFLVGEQHNSLVDNYINSLRSALGITLLTRDASMRGVIGVARNGGVVSWLSDQDAGRNGLVVNYFGLPASTPRGAAAFSVKLNMPIAIGGMVRMKGPRQKFVLTAFLTPDHSLSREEAELDITQRYTTALEELVRENPEQYWWAHRRWKSTTDIYKRSH